MNDNTDDLLNSIENGNVHYSLDPNQMLLELIAMVSRNQILLEHIIDELYEKDEERDRIVDLLNEAAKKEGLKRLIAIINRSKKKES